MKNCQQSTYEERVRRMAKIIWNRKEYEARRVAGVCQFCGEILKHSYRVAKNGELYTCSPGSESERKALELIKNPQEWVFVFPVSSCEVMTKATITADFAERSIYTDAIEMTKQWRVERNRANEPEKARVKEVAEYQSF